MSKKLFIRDDIHAIVDDEDYERLNKFKWSLQEGKNTYYAARNDKSSGKRKYIYLHRAVLNVTDSKILVDHINGNGLDNRKSNLRLCNNSKNQANRVKSKHSTQPYRGIRRRRTLQDKYEARIRFKGKEYYLGRFDTAEEAALMYDLTLIAFHGEFANTNFSKEKIDTFIEKSGKVNAN